MTSGKSTVLAVAIVATASLIGGIFGYPYLSPNPPAIADLERDLAEANELIDQNFAGEINHQRLNEETISSMLNTLDPHSQFFPPKEFTKLHEEQASEFYGIGVSISQFRDGVYVQSVIPGTPADKAGVKYGDRFVGIDGEDARELTSAEVSGKVRGPEGTVVKVAMERAGQERPVEFTISRGGVPSPSIRNSFMMSGGVGYIGLTGGFQETTSDELDAALNDLKSKGMTSLILDLRGNPGGLLTQAREVVSRFTDKGKIVVSVKGRSSYATKDELYTSGGDLASLPLVILVNESSASASEIVAGAMQDYDRAIIIGTGNTFGKGLVQRVFPLAGGAGMTLTIARYYTPLGRSLQRDYSNGSNYEYYLHLDENGEPKNERPVPTGTPFVTLAGRSLFGGLGIQPDYFVEIPRGDVRRQRSQIAAFMFARKLVSGEVTGFGNFRNDRPSYRTDVTPSETTISDALFGSFKSWAGTSEGGGLSAKSIDAESTYLKLRLRLEIATARHSVEAGQRILLDEDPVLLKAIEMVSEARRLVGINQ